MEESSFSGSIDVEIDLEGMLGISSFSKWRYRSRDLCSDYPFGARLICYHKRRRRRSNQLSQKCRIS